MIVQLLIVLAALYVGSRYGSLALGAISGIGLAILVFGFGLKPGTPPTDVIYIIIAAVTCAGTLQASGGMDWMIQIAERMLRKHPDQGPLVTFFLTVLVGTGHVVYTIMPIICDIALKKGIRPERPCGVASVASQVGITCSPIAAAVVAFVTISNANGYMVSIPQVLLVTIPACLIGLMCASAASYKRGKDLDKDPEFIRRKSDPELYNYMYGSSATTLDKDISREAKASVFIFLGSLLVIVGFAFCQMIQVDQNGESVSLAKAMGIPKMNIIIQIIHGGRGGHLRHCLVGRHLFRQLHGADEIDAHRPGDQLPLEHRLRVLPGECAHQFPGSRGRGLPAAGLSAWNCRSGAAGRAAERVRVFLHPELSVRYRHGELRPFRNDGDREVFVEP